MSIFGFYGMFANPSVVADVAPEAKFLGVGYIHGYRLAVYGHATVERGNRGDGVWLALYEISPEDELLFDRAEGCSPSGRGYYRKERVVAALQASRRLRNVEVKVYVMNEEHREGRASDFYTDMIRDGYVACGIPALQLDEAL